MNTEIENIIESLTMLRDGLELADSANDDPIKKDIIITLDNNISNLNKLSVPTPCVIESQAADVIEQFALHIKKLNKEKYGDKIRFCKEHKFFKEADFLFIKFNLINELMYELRLVNDGKHKPEEATIMDD